MKWSKGKSLLLVGVVLVVIDQVIKVLVKTNMTLGESIPVLGNWFQLLFVENKGMAFGMAFGGVVGKYLLTAFRIVLFGVLCWWIAKLLRRGNVPMGVLVGLTLITAGAFGNIVEERYLNADGQPCRSDDGYAKVCRVWRAAKELLEESYLDENGQAVVFFEPVFNFADGCVTVGAIYLILFHWKFFAKE